jgi:hypothetical protein
MFDNAQKIWMGRSLNQLALNKALEVIHQQGRALPCSVTAVSGSIVTVKFEVNAGKYTLPQVTVPVFGPEYIRYPTQVGDKGIVLPADTYIGNVTGLGGGTPSLSLPGNLSALVFLPVANKNWSATDDPNAIVLYGPDGGILRTVDKTSKVNVSKTGTAITVPAGKSVSISSLPTSPAGLPSGSLWNSGGQVMTT